MPKNFPAYRKIFLSYEQPLSEIYMIYINAIKLLQQLLNKIFIKDSKNLWKVYLSTNVPAGSTKLLSKFQYGFRKCFSAQHSLLLMVEKWRETLDNGDACGALRKDLSKAIRSPHCKAEFQDLFYSTFTCVTYFSLLKKYQLLATQMILQLIR